MAVSKHTSPLGYDLGLSLFSTINPWHLCYNYNVMYMRIYVSECVCTSVRMTYYCCFGRSVKECMITCVIVHCVWVSNEGVDYLYTRT